MADPFSQDIIYGIFSRLPVKSLARFRCVCKLWLKYINDPYLDTIHVKEKPTPIMFEQSEFREIKINLLRGSTRVRHEPVLELGHVSLLPCGWLLVGLCDGLALVCYQQQPVGTYQIVVINPLSKQRHDLPPLSIKMKPKPRPHHAAGIGFDDSTNTFKTVFSVVKDQGSNVVCTMVHSSGSSSWREIPQTPPYPIGGEAVFAHGRLHWLFDFRALDSVGTTIVWFDIKTEQFGLTDPPKPKQVARWTDINRLVYLNGELGYSFFGHYGIHLWILKQQEEWVLHCCFDLSPFMPPVNLDVMDEYYDLEISGCWNHYGDLLLTLDGGCRLFVYTLKTGHLRELDLGDPCHGSFIRMYQSSTLVLHDRFRGLELDALQSSIAKLSLVNSENTKKIEKLNEVMTELVKGHEKEKERLNGIIAELTAERERDKLEKDAMKKWMWNIEAMLTSTFRK